MKSSSSALTPFLRILHVLLLLAGLGGRPALAGEQAAPQAAAFPKHEKLANEFRAAIKSLTPVSDSEKLTERLAAFDVPARLLAEMGYRNAPWVSEELLNVSRDALALGRPAEARAIFEKAVELSPADPKTLFSAAVVISQAEPALGLRLFLQGLVNLPFRPAAVALIWSDLLITAMAGATLAGFLMCIFLFVMHRERLLRMSASFLPPRWQGLSSPLLLAVPILLAVQLGILAIMVLFAVLIYRAERRYRTLPIVIGGILIFWPLVLTVSGKLRMKAGFSVDQQLAELNSFSLLADPSQVARYVLVQRPSDSFARNLYGMLLLREGQNVEAEKIFREVLSLSTDAALSRNALTNVGATLAAQGRFREAKENLTQAESRGETSFAVYHWRTRAAMALTETAEHEALYTAASHQDPAMQALIERHGIEESAAVTAPVSTLMFYSRLPGNFGWQGSVPNAVRQEKEGMVLRALLWRGSSQVFFVIGGLLFILPLFRGRAALRLPNERETAFRLTLLSGIFPGTWSIAQGALIFGWGLLTLFFFCILGGVGEPVPMTGFHSLQLSTRPVFGTIAVLLLVSSFVAARRRLGSRQLLLPGFGRQR